MNLKERYGKLTNIIGEVLQSLFKQKNPLQRKYPK